MEMTNTIINQFLSNFKRTCHTILYVTEIEPKNKFKVPRGMSFPF